MDATSHGFQCDHWAPLVVLSYTISVLGAYCALQWAGQIRQATGWLKASWVGGAAVAMGGGAIWSMHFIAMIACRLPVPVAYDVTLTLASLVVAIVMTGIGLYVSGIGVMSVRRLLLGGVLTGLGVAAMHYTGMAAMELPAQRVYRPAGVMASVAIAIGAATAALWLAFNVRRGLHRAASSLVMGGAVCGMHYTAMAAVTFIPTHAHAAHTSAALESDQLGFIIFGLTIFVLALLSLGSNVINRQQNERLLRRAHDHLEEQVVARTADLDRQRAFLRQVIDTSPDFIFAKDRSGRFTLVNRAVADAYGTTVEELVGKKDADFNPNHDEVAFLAADLDVMNSLGERRIPEEKLTDSAGRVLWLQTVKRPIVGDDGKADQILAVSTDVTARKRAEEALRASEERLRLIIDTANDAFIAIDAEGSIVDWNRQAEATFGWSRSETLGRPLAETVIPSRHRAAHVAGLSHFLATGEGPVLRRTIEIDGLHRDGHEFPVELTIWPNRMEGVYRFNAFLRDISVRKRGEDALRKSEASIRMLYLIASTPIDFGTKVQAVLELGCRQIGLETGVLGRMEGESLEAMETHFAGDPWEPSVVRELMILSQGNSGGALTALLLLDPPAASSLTRSQIGACLGVPILIAGRLYGVLGFGSRQPQERRFEDADVDFLGLMAQWLGAEVERELHSRERELMGQLQDQDEALQRRTAQLEAANAELAAFSYSVSHDLRAPLHTIGGFSQVLLEDYGSLLDEEGREHIGRLQRGVQHMAHLIDDMLRLARVTRAELRREPVDLSHMARSLAEEWAEREPGRSVVLVIAEGLVANADPTLLRVVLENLLANAWKFTSHHPEARIEIGGMDRDGETVYFIRDDGAGFDMAYMERLFAPFARLHAATEFEGTGIGLATVQRVIHRHGGRVWAEGAVEKGATFFFTL